MCPFLRGCVLNAVSLVCFLGNRRVATAWGRWSCPTWERTRLSPDAEASSRTVLSSCLHTHPFTHCFIPAAHTCVHFLKDGRTAGAEKKEVKDLWTILKISSRLKKAQFAGGGLDCSMRGSSSSFIAWPTLPFFIPHAYIVPACFVSGFNCTGFPCSLATCVLLVFTRQFFQVYRAREQAMVMGVMRKDGCLHHHLDFLSRRAGFLDCLVLSASEEQGPVL